MPYRLDPTFPLAAEFVRIAREQVRRGLDLATRGGRSRKERLHGARTCCKKARAVLKLGRTGTGRWHRRENRRLADAARALARFRDADVLLDTLDRVRRNAGGRRSTHCHRRVRIALAAHARRAADEGGSLDAGFRSFAAALRASARQIDRWRPAPEFERVTDNFQRAYRRARHAFGRAGRRGDAAAFHEWRKASKVWLYECRLLRGAWEPGVKPLGRQMDRLCDDLGREHDLSVFRQQSRAFARGTDREFDHATLSAILHASGEMRREYRTRALRRGGRLFAEQPKALARRVKRWWRLASRQETAPAVGLAP